MDAGVDRLTCTFSVEQMDDLRDYFTVVFGDESAFVGRIQHYGSCYVYGDRAYLRYTLPHGESLGRSDISLDVPGKTLAAFSFDETFDFLNTAVEGFDGRPSRIDCRVDDYSWRVTPLDVWSNVQHSHGLKPDHLTEGMKERAGVSCYWGVAGKNGSGCQFTVYDKNAQSAGVINACRWEARFYGEKAQGATKHLLQGVTTAEAFAYRCSQLVFGVLDFTLDGKRLDWYADLISDTERVKISPVRKETDYSVQSCQRSIESRGVSLAALRLWYAQRNRLAEFHLLIDNIALQAEPRMDRRLRKAIDLQYGKWKQVQDETWLADHRDEFNSRVLIDEKKAPQAPF